MRKITFSYVLSWALGFIMMPTAYAESEENTKTQYHLPSYDKIQFSAEASGEKRVSMKWSVFEGINNEQFQYYKVIRSYANPNPVYPEDEAIAVKKGLGELRHVDEKAERSAYYRVCAITDALGRYCSNVVWVEIKKALQNTPCKNYAFDGRCEDTKYQKTQAEREAWEKQQNEAKAHLEEKKSAEKMKNEKAKTVNQEKAVQKKMENSKNKEVRQAELYARLYAKIDEWLNTFRVRLDKSNLSSLQKIAQIEAIQKRFYEWEQGKSVRVIMVDYLDKTLNQWKEEFSVGDDFSEIDEFLNGLLDS